ncbi:MAG: ABC transporter permease [Oscillospiraceae bacterium]|jgi:peptide/nickel transport system permease protein|nr:ABC transporter permease [Oscillospiraceae bacterium]
MRNKLNAEFKIGAVFTGIILALMLISLIYTPYDPYEMSMNIADKLNKPSAAHWLGTDNFGRDILSRLMAGIKHTMLVAVSTVSISLTTGVLLGLIAGYFGKALDEVIMRVMDAVSSFPGILLALVMVTVMHQGRYTIIIPLSILFIPSFTRIARGGLLQYKSADFVNNAKVFGASRLRIIFVHILPNVYPSLLSSLVLGLSNAIMAESGMSYLGLGLQPPIPSWGRILSEAQAQLFIAPWYAVVSGLFIIFTVVGLNFLGEGIRKLLP